MAAHKQSSSASRSTDTSIPLANIVIGAIYIALNFSVSQLARLLEFRLRRGRRHIQRAPMPGNTPI